MSRTQMIAFIVLTFGAMHTTPSIAAGWSCKAPGLVSGSYSGAGKAYIHLSGYKKGGRYTVTRVSSKEVAGQTKDGTKFTCKKHGA